jgi:hypothetical protein
MQPSFRIPAAALACLLITCAVGCTLFPEKKAPTLATTTSAEQHERILWQMAQKQDWGKIGPLFSTTLVWSVDGQALTRDEVVPYLKSLNLKDAAVREATVHPNGSDMTVSYTLQLSGTHGAAHEFSVFSVWQQLKGGGYVMIAHSQHSRAGSSAGTPGG